MIKCPEIVEGSEGKSYQASKVRVTVELNEESMYVGVGDRLGISWNSWHCLMRDGLQ